MATLLGADWRASVIAAAGLIVATGVIWRYIVAPFASAVWAAIIAAPQIRDDLRDLPELLAGLRQLIGENVIGQIGTLRVEVESLRHEVNAMRSPRISGGEGDPEPPLVVPMTPKRGDE